MKPAPPLAARGGIIATLVAATACVAVPPAGAPPPARATREIRDSLIAPGVAWRRIADRAGPWVINLVSVNLRQCRCSLRQVRALDSLAGREKVSAMVARQPEGAARVLAAINADFFNLQTGEVENNQVIAGEWWKGMRGSDSPYDSFAAVRTHFAVDAGGRPMLDRFVLDGTAFHASGAVPILAVNFLGRGGPETSVLYTRRRGTTPRDTVRPMAEVALRAVARRSDTTVYVAAAAPAKVGGNAVPEGGAVLAAYGPRANALAKFTAGDTVRVVLRAAANRGDGPFVAPQLLIGGWPRVLRAGENVAARAAWDEGTLSSNAEARHPRSAIGFSRDSTTLYLVTVDGRQAASVGVTLVELADLLKAEGAWDALNFDGGGSTVLVLRGRVANSPSDPAGERAVGNALLVVARP